MDYGNNCNLSVNSVNLDMLLDINMKSIYESPLRSDKLRSVLKPDAKTHKLSDNEQNQINNNFKLGAITQTTPQKVSKASNSKPSNSPARLRPQPLPFTNNRLIKVTRNNSLRKLLAYTNSKSKLDESKKCQNSALTPNPSDTALPKLASVLASEKFLTKSRKAINFLGLQKILKEKSAKISNSNNFLQTLRSIPHNTVNKSRVTPHEESVRKLFAAFRHYKRLGLNLLPKSKLFEFFPGVAYGLDQSKEFLKACKEGEFRVVSKLLEKRQWLAHSFDCSCESALHWAALRGHLNIVEILLDYGAYVNVRDFVRDMQAGRTPLFLAAKYSNSAVFEYLLERNANPGIGTRAGKKVAGVCKDFDIKRILDWYRNKRFLGKFS